jgi:hypothetical protein
MLKHDSVRPHVTKDALDMSPCPEPFFTRARRLAGPFGGSTIALERFGE